MPVGRLLVEVLHQPCKEMRQLSEGKFSLIRGDLLFALQQTALPSRVHGPLQKYK